MNIALWFIIACFLFAVWLVCLRNIPIRSERSEARQRFLDAGHLDDLEI